jgi:hypothetical protein
MSGSFGHSIKRHEMLDDIVKVTHFPESIYDCLQRICQAANNILRLFGSQGITVGSFRGKGSEAAIILRHSSLILIACVKSKLELMKMHGLVRTHGPVMEQPTPTCFANSQGCAIALPD